MGATAKCEIEKRPKSPTVSTETVLALADRKKWGCAGFKTHAHLFSHLYEQTKMMIGLAIPAVSSTILCFKVCTCMYKHRYIVVCVLVTSHLKTNLKFVDI